MKLSARNQIPARVTAIQAGEAIANVELDANGVRMVASITVEAVKQLGLTEGSSVIAVIKASDVIVALRLARRRRRARSWRIMEASPPATPGCPCLVVLTCCKSSASRSGRTAKLRGTASVTPYMRVPGTDCLRASILASWADMLCGLLSMRAFAGRVSVTLELDVHLYRPAPGSGTVTAVGRQVKAGRSVFVGEVEFADARGEAFGFSAASFMVAPDTTLRPPRLPSLEIPPQDARLSMPLADRADCKRQAPGVAVLHKSEDGLNSAKTVHGGLIALAAEEAVLSLQRGLRCRRWRCATCSRCGSGRRRDRPGAGRARAGGAARLRQRRPAGGDGDHALVLAGAVARRGPASRSSWCCGGGRRG